MPVTCRYTDEQLREAIAAARSWRETLRRLGLSATSSAAIRSVRFHADRLAISYSHFTGGRRWTDEQLAVAVRDARSWSDVADRLDLRAGSAVALLQRHVARLGLDVDHFGDSAVKGATSRGRPFRTDISNLPRAGPQIAAAWYTMCGFDVSWPLEPCRYDLVVSGEGDVRRVQVKTTTTRERGAWRAHVSTNGRHTTRPYAADEIDDFFLIDGDLNFYIIPIEEMRGLHYVVLSRYEHYRVRAGR